ncbi:MAG: amino acid permease [Gemmatimonadaceae bacterium]
MSPLTSRKPIAALVADAEHGGLRRALGPGALVLLGIGAIIGAGIFVLTGNVAAQHTGPALVLAMILAGVACAFAGLCYAELASMIPVAGSAYTYAYATMGQFMAWVIGWDLVLEYSLASATVALGWGANAVSLLADLGIHVPPRLAAPAGAVVSLADGTTATALFNLPAALVVLAITALLVVGVKESARTNTVIVFIKLAVLVLFVAVAARYVRPELWQPLIPPNTGTFGEFGWSGVVRGAGIIFFAYIGFDAVSTAAQEARNPQRDLPIGILGSLAVCTVAYISVALVLPGVVHYSRLNVADPINVGLAATGVTWLGPFIKVGALAGLFSVMLVNLMAQPRIFYAMSRDGFLPPAFGRIHPRFRTPHVTTTITGVLVATTAALFPIGVLGQLVSMGTLLAFAIVCAGVLVLRRTDPQLPRPFRAPGMPWVALGGLLVCVYLMLVLPLATWARLAVWLGLGLAIYFTYGRRNVERARAAGAVSRDDAAVLAAGAR